MCTLEYNFVKYPQQIAAVFPQKLIHINVFKARLSHGELRENYITSTELNIDMPHRKLHEIIANQELVCVAPTDTVSDTVERMQGNHVGSALVLEGNKVKGIFTGSNMLNRVTKAGLDPRKTIINDVMTPDPVCLHCGSHGIECVRVMREQNIRHIVVQKDPEDGFGIISVRDFPNEEICEYDQEFKFEENLWEKM